MIARLLRAAMFMACFLYAGSAFAAGGTCPSGANYVNPTTGAQVTLASLGVTSCYYISSSGSDTNSGTTESSPWLHSPGMKNCASSCAAVSITGGAGFLFRGGDTWHFGNSGAAPYAGVVPNCDFNAQQSAGLCLVGKNGSSGSPFYYGVDPTWYSGSSWSRPILTGDNPLTPHPGVFQDYVASCTYQIGAQNKIISFENSTYGILDGFELTGLCSQTNNSSADKYIVENGPLTSNNTYERLYIHGWTHIQFSASYNDNIILFSGTNNSGLGDSHIMNVVDGSDSDPGGIQFLTYAGAYNYAYNVFRYAANFVVTSTHTIHDNLLEHWYGEGDEVHHPNLYEENGEANGTNAIYNNVFRNACDNNNCPVGSVGTWLFPPVGTTTYYFNNIIYDQNSGGNYFDVGENANQGNQGKLIIFNNIFEQPVSGSPILSCSASGFAFPFTVANNQYIIDGSSQYASFCAGQQTTITPGELAMTHGTATADGYTAAETYAYSPPSSNSPTVGHGTNEQAFCTALSAAGLSGAATACQSGTTYACAYNSTTHTISCPAQTAVARPASAAWDVGAYQFSGAQASAPKPPTGLTASVQ